MQNKNIRNLMVGSYKTVQEWNDVFEIHAKSDANMRICITGEEILELARAKTKQDKVDALCDIIWTLQGTWIDFSAPLIEDHKRYPAPAINDAVSILAEFSHWVYRKHSPVAPPSDNINDLVPGIITEAVCQMLVNTLGIEGAERAWGEVRRTNFAKIWTEEEVNAHQVVNDKLTDDKDTYSDYTYKEAQPGKWVVRNKNGKIQKPPTWTGPDWSWISEDAN